jgi:hypothetical protein
MEKPPVLVMVGWWSRKRQACWVPGYYKMCECCVSFYIKHATRAIDIQAVGFGVHCIMGDDGVVWEEAGIITIWNGEKRVRTYIPASKPSDT